MYININKIYTGLRENVSTLTSHWDKAFSKMSMSTNGSDATSKNTLKRYESINILSSFIHINHFITNGLRVDLLVRVFVSDGSQFVVRRSWKRRVELSDERRQIWRPVARVELQDGRLSHKRYEGRIKTQPCWILPLQFSALEKQTGADFWSLYKIKLPTICCATAAMITPIYMEK